jgi:hypothetical protein
VDEFEAAELRHVLGIAYQPVGGHGMSLRRKCEKCGEIFSVDFPEEEPVRTTCAGLRHCAKCDRQLDVSGDPLSRGMTGNCWGCVGEILYNHCSGDEMDIEKVRDEISRGMRDRNGKAR